MTVPREIGGVREERERAGGARGDPHPSAVSFVTTEHFALQSARAATISESTGRATMFLASASGGLIALGVVASATGVGTAFYAFGIVLLPTLAFVGWVTFERTLQTGLEDYLLARRIALLREYYFHEAPELGEYLMSVPHPEVFTAGRRQVFRSVAGMVGVITAVLVGATAGLIATVASNHSLVATLISGIAVGLAAIVVLMRSQESAFARTTTTPLLADSTRDEARS
jgi:hypothetical protein